MKINFMGWIIARELVKRELGVDKQQRANQLALVGAMSPSPIMGAVLAQVIAKKEKPAKS